MSRTKPIKRSTIAQYRAEADTFLKNHSQGLIRQNVVSGALAWEVAHRIGFSKWAYANGYSDGHIQTALGRIFPNVQLQEVRRY
jgi:hypothetical protein